MGELNKAKPKSERIEKLSLLRAKQCSVECFFHQRLRIETKVIKNLKN